MSINSLSFGNHGFGHVSHSHPSMRGGIGHHIKQALQQYRQGADAVKTSETSGISSAQTLFGGAASGGVDYDAIARALLARLDALWQARGQQWGNFGNGETSHACGCHHHNEAGTTTAIVDPPVVDSAPSTPAADTTDASDKPSTPVNLPPATSPTGSTGAAGVRAALHDLPLNPTVGLVLNDESNLNIVGLHLNGTENGIMVDNGQLSENVTIDGLVAENTTRYGMYLGAVRNWSISNTTLRQAAGANEHGLRIADGEHITINNTTIDTTRAGKSAMWLINVDDAVVENSTISGGAIRIGARPNDNQGSANATNIVIRDSVINKVSGGDANAFEVWPGSNHIHLENLDITCTTSSTWLSIDSRNTANITWENIRVNGELITGFEGVRLGDMTEEQAIARGIGPAGAVA